MFNWRNIFKPSETWVSGDFHYSHKNMIKSLSRWKSGAVRDFDSVKSMNDCIVDTCNSLIKKHHTLIFLGDWAFGRRNIIELRERLVVENIIFVAGNHDQAIAKDPELQKLFSVCFADLDVYFTPVFKIGNQKYVCSHFAGKVWHKNGWGYRHLYAHSHGNLPDDKTLSIDVGLDAKYSNFRPLNFAHDIEKIMSDKEKQNGQ